MTKSLVCTVFLDLQDRGGCSLSGAIEFQIARKCSVVKCLLFSSHFQVLYCHKLFIFVVGRCYIAFQSSVFSLPWLGTKRSTNN